MYTNNVAHVLWNGIASRSSCVKNGVRQGGIISPILFCVYLDGLLVTLVLDLILGISLLAH